MQGMEISSFKIKGHRPLISFKRTKRFKEVNHSVGEDYLLLYLESRVLKTKGNVVPKESPKRT